jgi:hypothetical protein
MKRRLSVVSCAAVLVGFSLATSRAPAQSVSGGSGCTSTVRHTEAPCAASLDIGLVPDNRLVTWVLTMSEPR